MATGRFFFVGLVLFVVLGHVAALRVGFEFGRLCQVGGGWFCHDGYENLFWILHILSFL